MEINYPQLKSKEITLTDMDGEDVRFKLHRVPAILGRKIFSQYIPTAMPKIGNYADNERLMLELLVYVQVAHEGNWLPLNNQIMIDSHVTSWEMLVSLEKEMVCFNTNFLQKGNLSRVFQSLIAKVVSELKNTETSTQS